MEKRRNAPKGVVFNGRPIQRSGPPLSFYSRMDQAGKQKGRHLSRPPAMERSNALISLPGHPDQSRILAVMKIERPTMGAPERFSDPPWKMDVGRCDDHAVLFRVDRDNPAEGMLSLRFGLLIADQV